MRGKKKINKNKKVTNYKINLIIKSLLAAGYETYVSFYYFKLSISINQLTINDIV